MVITYHGKEFIKITHGDFTLACNPISTNAAGVTKKDISHFGADVVFITTNHPDYNGVDAVSYGNKKEPFIISGPGDYEVHDLFVHGYMMRTTLDDTEYISTVYQCQLDGMTICFLGPINTAKLPAEMLEQIGEPDILFIPVGGGDVLSPQEAHKLANALDARAIIPIDYGTDPKKSTQLQEFLKESGAPNLTPVEKVTVKKKDLEELEGTPFVLTW